LGRTICHVQIQRGVFIYPPSLLAAPCWISPALQLYKEVLLGFYCDVFTV
jgi:hypothetical protein